MLADAEREDEIGGLALRRRSPGDRPQVAGADA